MCSSSLIPSDYNNETQYTTTMPKSEDENLTESNYYEAIESFDDMNLHKMLLRGIYAYGYILFDLILSF